MTVSSIRIQRLAGIACLSALAFVLMMLEFPIIPVAAYLKLDFSDVPVLLGTLIYGPVSGIIIAAVKCLIHALVYGFQLASFWAWAATLFHLWRCCCHLHGRPRERRLSRHSAIYWEPAREC